MPRMMPLTATGHARIQIGDRDFDSFANVMQTAPWVVGLVFLVVGSIFLTPLILLVGIIWYKLRKTRLQNDALLKLAERGVVPSAQVAEAMWHPVRISTPAATGLRPRGRSNRRWRRDGAPCGRIFAKA